jgi:hypothetical protein
MSMIRVRTTSAADPPAWAKASSAISRQRRVWPYASSGGSASPGMIGAVPADEGVLPDADDPRVARRLGERRDRWDDRPFHGS